MKKFLLLALICCVGIMQAQAQYCTPAHSNTCAVNSFLTSIAILGTPFAPAVPTACAGTSPVITFGATGTDLMTIAQGTTYTLTGTSGALSSDISLWIDYNQDLTYDATEWIDLGRGVAGGTGISVSFTVPATAISGRTGARLRIRGATFGNTATDACASFASGATYEFSALIGAALACSGQPATPTLNLTTIALCPADSINLTYTNPPSASGIVVAWQISTDGGNTWAAAAGANTGFTYKVKGSVIGTAPAQFRLSSTCSAAGGAVFSAPTTYTSNPTNLCYCVASHGANCTPATIFTAVTGTGGFSLVMPTVCTPNGYTPPVGGRAADTLSITQASTFTFDVTTGTSAVSGSLFIDYNQNGSFEASEWVDLGRNLAASSTVSNSITVPSNATVGITVARLRNRLNGNVNGATDACTVFGSGNTIDFYVKVLAGAPCVGAPIAATITTDTISLCGGGQANLRATNLSGGTGLVYEWQVSTDAGITWAAAQGTNTTGTAYVFDATYLGRNPSVQVRYLTTCAGASTPSNVVTISANSAAACACIAAHGTNCSDGELFTVVTAPNGFAPLLPMACAPNGFTPATGGSFPDTLYIVQNTTFNLDVTTGTTAVSGSFWIDFDQNGLFEAAEWTDLGRIIAASSTASTSISVPATASLGLTKARLRNRLTGNPNGDINACTIFGSGGSQDFYVRISTVVGLQNAVSFQNSVRVFPNPTSKQVTVTVPAVADGKVTFTITDLSGRTVGAISPASISGADYVLPLNLAPGAYQLNVVTTNGVAHSKLIVQ